VVATAHSILLSASLVTRAACVPCPSRDFNILSVWMDSCESTLTTLIGRPGHMIRHYSTVLPITVMHGTE
jgi:hypothetical protein